MTVYSHLDDNDLLLLLRQGQEAAFTEIYNRYWERLVATGYYYTRTRHAAEEIVNDVLMGLWLRKDDLVIRSLSAYLGTAVKFAVFKSISRQRRRAELAAGNIAYEEAHQDTEQQLEARFLEEYVRGVVEQLPEKARLVFTYSRDENLSVKEIAGKLELSTKSVEYYMTKALKVIRDAVRKVNIFLITAFFTFCRETFLLLTQL